MLDLEGTGDGGGTDAEVAAAANDDVDDDAAAVVVVGDIDNSEGSSWTAKGADGPAKIGAAVAEPVPTEDANETPIVVEVVKVGQTRWLEEADLPTIALPSLLLVLRGAAVVFNTSESLWVHSTPFGIRSC